MNFSSLSRIEKEKLYIKKMTELQKLWGNPIDDDWQFVNDGTDEEMDKMLSDVIGQLRYEKGTSFFNKLISYGIKGFVLLGIIGLLLFGIRQLFSLG